MMTPLRFEQLHQDEWSELEIAIGSVGTQTISKSMSLPPTRGARVALLYRRWRALAPIPPTSSIGSSGSPRMPIS